MEDKETKDKSEELIIKSVQGLAEQIAVWDKKYDEKTLDMVMYELRRQYVENMKLDLFEILERSIQRMIREYKTRGLQ